MSIQGYTVKSWFIIIAVLCGTSLSYAVSYNAFDVLYTGTRNDFSGRVGYTFRAEQTFDIHALGRSVNTAANGGVLQAAHTIELFEVSSQNLLATVTITSSSAKDTLGYAFKMLSSPVTLTSGLEYMIVSDETSDDGDPWLDSSYVSGYRDDLMTILGCQWWGNHAGNPMPDPYYTSCPGNVFVPPTFYTDIPDPTPPQLSIEDFSFTSSFDSTGPLWARAVYPPDAVNLPLMVVQHGYGSTRDAVMYSAERMALNGFFCLAVDVRGWDGSAGAHDDGGVEIMDIYDAIEEARQLYPTEVDPNLVSIIGYSNGGGNVFFSTVRFPFLFRASMALFGVVDYGQWIALTDAWDADVIAAVGGTPTQVPDKYFVRRSEEAASNLSGTHFHIAYDEAEWMCPPVMDQEFAAAVPSAQQENLFVHISQATDPDRWTHAHNTTGHLNAIEDLFMADIHDNNLQTPIMPNSASLVVLGFIVTPKFSCFLGNGDDAAATVDYDIQGDQATFNFSPLTSDSMVTGTITLTPDIADHDTHVYIDSVKTTVIPQGEKLEITFPITSSVHVNSAVFGIDDLIAMASAWLSDDPQWDTAPTLDGDGTVNLSDFADFSSHWQP